MDTTMDNTLAMTVQAGGDAALAPTTEEVALLTRQYQKALDGLFEAYQFGMMLRAVKERLDRETACGTTVEQNADGTICGRAPGLKGWLATYCPEINYSTARRFLAVAEKTVSALALAEAEGGVDDGSPAPTGAGRGEAPCASAGEGARSPFPPEAKVREFLAGKSQRAVLRLGGRREGAGRKAKDWAAALEASPEVAWKELAEPLDRLSDLIVRQRRHAALTAQDLHTLRDAIDLLHEVIHADA